MKLKERARNNVGFEERYEDVLQNLEFAIVQTDRDSTGMTNANVKQVLLALQRQYKLEMRRGTPLPVNLTGLNRVLYDNVRQVCEWRLGRGSLLTTEDEDGEPEEIMTENPISHRELLRCLKRIQKSVKFWTKEAGRRGYLDYVGNFIV